MTISNDNLPPGWRWESLADVAADGAPILYGILQPGPDTPGGVPYVRPTEIVEDVIDLSSIRCTTPAIAGKYKRSLLKPDDIILSIVGTIGKVAVVPPELDGGNITQSSVRVRPRSEVVSPRYVAWVLRSPVLRRQFDKHRLGTAVPRLNVAHVRALRVPVPPLPEQHRIVAEIEKQFTRLDSGVAALRRVRANLKRYRAAVLKAACEGRLVPTEAELARKEALFGGSIPKKAREAGSTPAALHGVQKVVSSGLTSPTSRTAGSNPVGRPKSGIRDGQVEGSNLSVPTTADTLGVGGSTPSASTGFETGEQLLQRTLAKRRENWSGRGKYMEPQSPKQPVSDILPLGWTWATFEQLSERVTVGFVGPMKHEYVESGVPFLRGQNVRENRFDPEGLLYVSRSFHETLSKSALQPGDLAVVRSGGVGVTCVIPPTLKEANCSDLVLIQRPLGFIPQYGAYYMNSLAKRHVEAGKVGVALTHFNTKSVAALAVPLPPLSEQKRIVAEVERRLSVIDELEAVVTANLQRATRLRRAILQQAFSVENK